MLLAELLEEIKGIPSRELLSIEAELRSERLRRARVMASTVEARLREIIDRPAVNAKRFASLTQKWEEEGLTDNERRELLEIVNDQESQHVERVEAVRQLSELKGIDFLTLWHQLLGEARGH